MFLKLYKKVYNRLFLKIKNQYNRSLPLGDYLNDRWERAEREGFGVGTSVYDNVLILGDVKVGKHTWIGPNVVLDGSGGLEIGDYCSISAGVQIYSHHTVKWSTSLGKEEIEYKPTIIGNGVFIGPNSIIQMGTKIDDESIIGALSFVNKNIKKGQKYINKKEKL
jgi:acetyltransferase-like isoleucine patch superfamily enzyme